MASINFGGPNKGVEAELEMANQQAHAANLSETQRMAFVRQHMLNAMGMGNNYIYQTDSGIEANKINDDMMREILQQTKRN